MTNKEDRVTKPMLISPQKDTGVPACNAYTFLNTMRGLCEDPSTPDLVLRDAQRAYVEMTGQPPPDLKPRMSV